MSEWSKMGIQNRKEPDALERVVELSLLYDFYGALLKEQKREIFEDYILNDLSLGEIAEERGISRQGIHDSIKRCCKELAEYEEKLGLMEKFNRIKEQVGKIHKVAKFLKEEKGSALGTAEQGHLAEKLFWDKVAESLEEIASLSDEILEEL